MKALLQIPSGFIKVRKTQKKVSGSDAREDYWVAFWRPEGVVNGIKFSGRYAFRAGSKFGEHAAVLRIKHKVAAYFGYPHEGSRNQRVSSSPVIDEANAPWKLEYPGARRPGKLWWDLPPGKFVTRTTKIARHAESSTRTNWKTTWTPEIGATSQDSPSPKGNESLKIVSSSSVSREESIRLCTLKVLQTHAPEAVKQALATREKEKLKRSVLLEVATEERIKSMTVSMPPGTVTFKIGVSTYGAFPDGETRLNTTVSVEWIPENEEGRRLVESIYNGAKSGGRFYSPGPPLEQVKKRLILAASGLNNAKRNGLFPMVDALSRPWGGPLFEIESDVFAGVTRGEIQQFHHGRGTAKTGHTGEYGFFMCWRPARIFDRAPEGKFTWVTGFGKTEESATKDCLEHVEFWLSENYPDEQLRPKLPEVSDLIDTGYFSELLGQEIQVPRTSRFVTLRAAKARARRHEALF